MPRTELDAKREHDREGNRRRLRSYSKRALLEVGAVFGTLSVGNIDRIECLCIATDIERLEATLAQLKPRMDTIRRALEKRSGKAPDFDRCDRRTRKRWERYGRTIERHNSLVARWDWLVERAKELRLDKDFALGERPGGEGDS